MTRYFKSPFKKNKRLHKLINIAKKLHVFKGPLANVIFIENHVWEWVINGKQGYYFLLCISY